MTSSLAAARDADEEPAPAPTPLDPNNLAPYAEVTDRDRRRQLLAELRANGVETELRGDQVFRVVRLPAFTPDRLPAAAKTQLLAPRASWIA